MALYKPLPQHLIRVIVPLPIPENSSWLHFLGCSWRLEPRRIYARSICFSLSVCSRSNALLHFRASLSLPGRSDSYPVQNLHVLCTSTPRLLQRTFTVLPTNCRIRINFPPLPKPTNPHFFILQIHITVLFAGVSAKSTCFIRRRSQELSAQDSTHDNSSSEMAIVWLNNSRTDSTQSVSLPSHSYHRCSTISRGFLLFPVTLIVHDDFPNVKTKCTLSADLYTLVRKSTVFRAMFNVNMKERSSTLVNLDRWSKQCVRDAIAFMFDTQITVPTTLGLDRIIDLYRFAHFFDISTLFAAIQQTIAKTIDLDTCCFYLRLSEYYSDSDLRKTTKDFIGSNFADMGLNSTELGKLSLSLMIELLQLNSITASELQVAIICLRWLNRQSNIDDNICIFDHVRWPLLTPHMWDVIVASNFVELYPDILALCSITNGTEAKERIGRHENSAHYANGRRASASAMVATITAPPPVAKQQNELSQGGKSSTAKNLKAQRFMYDGLQWGFFALMEPKEVMKCCRRYLRTCFWLEESRDDSRKELPVRVLARYQVHDEHGAQVDTRIIDVEVEQPGWAHGWSLRFCVDDFDLEETRKIDVVHVKIEILCCTQL